jgi:YegS/Rv2252/BmrU family lipid kinase
VTTILLVNPAAGRGRAARAAPEAQHAIGSVWGPARRIDTTAPGSAIEQVRRAVEEDVERIVVLGGDGTLHEAVNGLLQARVERRPPVAIVPAGTGNDYAKLAGTVGLSPAAAIRRLAAGEVRRFDVGVADGEYFINSVGIGFDAEVARVVSRWKWARGLPAYLAAVFQVLARFDSIDVEVSADAAGFADRLLLLEIAIGPCVGGGFRLTPEARPDDGWLDLCAIQQLSLPAALLRLPLAMIGKHTRLRQVRMLRATTVLVRSRAGPLHAQLDGELRDVNGPLHIRLEPGVLPVLIAR